MSMQPNDLLTSMTTTKWPFAIAIEDQQMVVGNYVGYAVSSFVTPVDVTQYRQAIIDDVFEEFAEEWRELAEL